MAHFSRYGPIQTWACDRKGRLRRLFCFAGAGAPPLAFSCIYTCDYNNYVRCIGRFQRERPGRPRASFLQILCRRVSRSFLAQLVGRYPIFWTFRVAMAAKYDICRARTCATTASQRDGAVSVLNKGLAMGRNRRSAYSGVCGRLERGCNQCKVMFHWISSH